MKFLGFLIAIFLCACSSDNGVSSFMEEKISQEAEAYSSSQNNYYSSSSLTTYNDCYYYGIGCSSSSAYVYSSSSKIYSSSSVVRSSSSYYIPVSSSSKKIEYLTQQKTMQIFFTYYEQLYQVSEALIGSGGKSNADPQIKMKVVFYDENLDTLSSTTTGWFLNYDYEGANVGKWTGSKNQFVTVPFGTYRISVCPIIYNWNNGLAGTDNLSSGYCYHENAVGNLGYREDVFQEDYSNKTFILEWRWYLE